MTTINTLTLTLSYKIVLVFKIIFMFLNEVMYLYVRCAFAPYLNIKLAFMIIDHQY